MSFALSTQAKEAIKTALAFVLAYGIALRLDWMNPYWAAFAVAMISLPTAGQSLFKGALRMGGTLLGCIVALAILALAPQERWTFILLICAWTVFATYMMTGSRHAYFWHVSGFVCLIVTLAGPSSPENAFPRAVVRTVETAMGIGVYTLVTVFIWPRTNIGAAKQAARDLLATQSQLLHFCGVRLGGEGATEDGRALRTQQVNRLGQLNTALQAEGSESYQVHEMRHQWTHLSALSSSLMASLDRWYIGLVELADIDTRRILPNLDAYLLELDGRFKQVGRMLDGQAPEQSPQMIALQLNASELRGMSHFDRAAIAVTRKEIGDIERLTRSLFDCVEDLAGYAADDRRPESPPSPAVQRRGVGMPVPDVDRLWGATMAATTVAVGFCVWIFFNPPGHASMYQLAGTVAMAVAATPQLKANALVKPFAVAMVLGLAVYVFVLPRLSGFAELAVPIFLFAFVTCYFFKGVGRLAGLIAMINMISIQNEQTYNFAAMANSYVFTLMAFILVFVVSHMIGSPRPEKTLLHLLSRFFHSAASLMPQMAHRSGGPLALGRQWRAVYHRRTLASLPKKLAAWGRAIDQGKFPSNTPKQVQSLVARLQVLVYRVEELLETGHARQSASLTDVMRDDVRAWRENIQTAFEHWSDDPGAAPAAALRDRLAAWRTTMDARIDETLAQYDREEFSDEEGENFYRLLGGYLGVSEAAVAYAGVAAEIDWMHWREERF